MLVRTILISSLLYSIHLGCSAISRDRTVNMALNCWNHKLKTRVHTYGSASISWLAPLPLYIKIHCIENLL
ncbi:hypothetical protein F5884DRAFT_785523 [Xylogone sp. PMI_703]|nr:hypothetical protein F5884DRAFT_785523 [Xylogone sp. PMI_703]